MKRLLLSAALFFSLLGAVGCTNNSKVDEPTLTPTITIAINNSTPVPTNLVTENKPEENLNTDISSFIPDGWHILEKNDGQPASVEGDLNQDGIMDKAIVIEEDDRQTESDYFVPSRSLLIAFKNKDNSYSLSIKADKAIMLRDEGGVFGDPFQDIKIERGSILLEFYGGSNSRWYMYYRFRYQNDGWYLIGATKGSYLNTVTTMDNADEEDYNLLTGDYIIKKFEDGEIKTTKGNRGKRQLINLKDFVPDIDESQF